MLIRRDISEMLSVETSLSESHIFFHNHLYMSTLQHCSISGDFPLDSSEQKTKT